MNQEDDLRALGKIMDLLRAISVMFVITNIYWYCYPEIQEWGFDIAVVDRILANFDDNIFYNFYYFQVDLHTPTVDFRARFATQVQHRKN